MLLYVVSGVGGGDNSLVEQEITRLVLWERDEDILPEDKVPKGLFTREGATLSASHSRTECFAVQLVERYRAGDN